MVYIINTVDETMVAKDPNQDNLGAYFLGRNITEYLLVTENRMPLRLTCGGNVLKIIAQIGQWLKG